MFGILITAYQEIDRTENNIIRIRNKYGKYKNIPIIVITTSEIDIGFKKLEQYSDVHVIEFKNAPGSKGSNFVTKSRYYPNVPGGEWRFKYIAARILFSMKLGIQRAAELNIKALLHLHSDTYWEEGKLDNLEIDFDRILSKNLLFIGDLSADFTRDKWLPYGTMFCPEGIVFNVDKCISTSYYNFDKIYEGPNRDNEWINKEEFYCPDYPSIEKLLGGWAHFIFTGKSLTCYEDRVEQEYLNNVDIRSIRVNHGRFDYGLVNFPGTQPFGDINDFSV